MVPRGFTPVDGEDIQARTGGVLGAETSAAV